MKIDIYFLISHWPKKLREDKIYIVKNIGQRSIWYGIDKFGDFDSFQVEAPGTIFAVPQRDYHMISEIGNIRDDIKLITLEEVSTS